jgi:DNA-binding SARP family transcriptional activator
LHGVGAESRIAAVATFEPSGAFEFQILGAIEVLRRGERIGIGAGQQYRGLLALLLIHANEALSPDRCIDALWGARPPATARNSLQNLVKRLRTETNTSRELVDTLPSGYILRVAPEQIDAFRFETLVARASRERGEERVATLATALALWHGRPLNDVFYEDFAQPTIRYLDELRASALEQRCISLLEIRDVNDVIPELQALVSAYPHREGPRRLLMLALYRAGRSVDALRCYLEWCATLKSEWGTTPGKALAQTASAIRAHEPEIESWSELTLPKSAHPEQLVLDPADENALVNAHVVGATQPWSLAGLDPASAGRIVQAVLRAWNPHLEVPTGRYLAGS